MYYALHESSASQYHHIIYQPINKLLKIKGKKVLYTHQMAGRQSTEAPVNKENTMENESKY